jgi:hypothetical protein
MSADAALPGRLVQLLVGLVLFGTGLWLGSAVPAPLETAA